LLYKLGVFSDRDLEVAERSANERKLATWKYAYLLDILADEQERGKTRDYCETPCTINGRCIVFVDTPGHHAFLRHMIEGTEGASVALWVVSMRPSETEKSLTDTEHLMLLRCLGIQHLIIVLNKCDLTESDSIAATTVKAGQVARKCGFAPKQVAYCCVSGWTGEGLVVPSHWTPSLIEMLGNIPEPLPDPFSTTTSMICMRGMVVGERQLITSGLTLIMQGGGHTLDVEVVSVSGSKPFVRSGEQATLSVRILTGTVTLTTKRFVLRNGDTTVFLGIIV
jgi:translation elongation factor EF-1alpha